MNSSPDPYRPPESETRRKIDWSTWNPVQSETVQQICAHLTPAEKRKFNISGVLWGLWTGVGLSFPITFIVIGSAVGPINWLYVLPCCLVLVAYCLSARPFLRWQKKMLCENNWARSQGITPDRLKLTRFFW